MTETHYAITFFPISQRRFTPLLTVPEPSQPVPAVQKITATNQNFRIVGTERLQALGNSARKLDNGLHFDEDMISELFAWVILPALTLASPHYEIRNPPVQIIGLIFDLPPNKVKEGRPFRL